MQPATENVFSSTPLAELFHSLSSAPCSPPHASLPPSPQHAAPPACARGQKMRRLRIPHRVPPPAGDHSSHRTQVISQARVPIVKFTHAQSRVDVDISLETRDGLCRPGARGKPARRYFIPCTLETRMPRAVFAIRALLCHSYRRGSTPQYPLATLGGGGGMSFSHRGSSSVSLQVRPSG